MINRERMIEKFIGMVRIDSVSGNEAQMHKYLKQELSALGLEVMEDNSQVSTGLGANNLIGVLPGNKSEKQSIFFSCHTDTVAPGTGIEVVEEQDFLYSAYETILGADDKAGIAILLEAIKVIQEEDLATGRVEFIFSPGEEIGLVGAAALNMNLIQSEMGYVLDNAGDVGNVIIASPTLYMYETTLFGKAAHAGLEPENGVSALMILHKALQHLPIGRVDSETTMNIGAVSGGETANIVLERLKIKGEVRSISDEKAKQLMEKIQHTFEETAKSLGGKVEMSIEKKAIGFRIDQDDPVMHLLQSAAKKIGRPVGKEVSGGGSDANIFNSNGKKTVNLSIGYEHIHTVNERVSIDEMEQAVRLVIELIKNTPEHPLKQ